MNNDSTPAWQLDNLISELLIRFVKISVEQIDSEIREFLQKIIEILDLDRGYLCQTPAGGTRMQCTHRWAAPGCVKISAYPGIANFPWLFRKIDNGELIAISTLADLPDEADKDREYFNGVGTKSFISLPMRIEGFLIGCMVIESVRTEKSWPDEVIDKLGTIVDVFTYAVKRKRRKLEMVERLRFETLMADISAHFVKLAPGEIDREIERSLERIGTFFNGDRCGILEVQYERELCRVTHAWYAPGIKRVPGEINLVPLFPWSYEKLINGQNIRFSSLTELPPEAEQDRQSWATMGVRSSLVIPVLIGRNASHLIAVQNLTRERIWLEEHFPRLRQLGEIFVNALTRKEAEDKLRKSCEEIQLLKDRLQKEAEYLRSEIRLSQPHEEIVGQSAALSKVLALVEQVAPTGSTVLVSGETGTGKELIAQAIHNLSHHRDKLMVKVNCASLPAALVESELFGREKGAYTGALTRQIGRFELADSSTIFLDEIAELSMELQAKLLRVLQDGQFERLGSPRTIKVNVRVIAATNRNLEEEIKKGNFREDLFYRLNVFPITVPPLRERVEDIPMLVWVFIREFGEKMGKKIQKIAKRDMEALQRYSWPGNVRELRNVIEHAAIVSQGETLQVRLPENLQKEISNVMTLEEVEYNHIKDVLNHTGWRVKGEQGAAQILGINPSTLYSRMQKLGISHHNEKDHISP